jgi:glycosyltransferase involved in cell wall biosynthesis
MRIAIDASRLTLARQTGTERYALELLRALIALNERQVPAHQLSLYFRSAPPPDLLPASDWVEVRVIPFRRAWTHLRFAWEIWLTQPDLTFVPAHTLPFILRGLGMVTVHDLGYRVFPQAHPALQRWYLDWTTRYSAQRARYVLADSQATANDLVRWYAIQPEKIHVVYPGVSAPSITNVDVRAKYGLPERYFLFVGTLQPRKNIARLVQAYTLWRAQNPQEQVGLVLAGGRGWLYEPHWTQGKVGVQELGYIDEADKGALLSGAVGLVFPSLYEGFGFPVLEALHCGTPVLSSNTSSLPELVGDAGLLVDPVDEQAIAEGMAQLVQASEQERHKWRERGLHQVQRFTWQSAAERVMALWNTQDAH